MENLNIYPDAQKLIDHVMSRYVKYGWQKEIENFRNCMASVDAWSHGAARVEMMDHRGFVIRENHKTAYLLRDDRHRWSFLTLETAIEGIEADEETKLNIIERFREQSRHNLCAAQNFLLKLRYLSRYGERNMKVKIFSDGKDFALTFLKQIKDVWTPAFFGGLIQSQDSWGVHT
jgi:hypothetical protein